MKIGLTGLPGSGKTTIFNALSQSDLPVGVYTDGKAEPAQAIIQVPDQRIDKLTALYQPKKTTYATVELTDFPAGKDNADDSGSLSANTIRLIKNLDALAIVIRNFDDDLNGTPDPAADLAAIYSELLLSDLMLVENRLEKIAWSQQRGLKTGELENEEKILTRIKDHLDKDLPLAKLELSESEQKLIRGFQFLTLKPTILILNSDESRFNSDQELTANLSADYPVIEFAGKFEMELSQLDDPDEQALFMEDMGITESARNRLARTVYEILGYISFFTVGEDEVRAWNVRRNATAVEAAGAIHSDLARGFIRAECFHYDDLIGLGSEAAVKKNGKFRLEGKTYSVQDGDILSIRFNI